MPQTCNEPAHVYHITVIAPPSSCEYAHLARTRHVTVVPFLWSNIFSSLKYCPVAKALNKGTTLKYHAEEEIHQITCRARSLPHVRQHTLEVRVTYCTAWPACRAILLRLLLRPGLGEEPGVSSAGELIKSKNRMQTGRRRLLSISIEIRALVCRSPKLARTERNTLARGGCNLWTTTEKP